MHFYARRILSRDFDCSSHVGSRLQETGKAHRLLYLPSCLIWTTGMCGLMFIEEFLWRSVIWQDLVLHSCSRARHEMVVIGQYPIRPPASANTILARPMRLTADVEDCLAHTIVECIRVPSLLALLFRTQQSNRQAIRRISFTSYKKPPLGWYVRINVSENTDCKLAVKMKFDIALVAKLCVCLQAVGVLSAPAVQGQL